MVEVEVDGWDWVMTGWKLCKEQPARARQAQGDESSRCLAVLVSNWPVTKGWPATKRPGRPTVHRCSCAIAIR